MAINLTDFDKIWASSSPLTPYSFSDANYEEGWNFVGATPPARQMWDGYMKWSDEKQQYIVNNFLPLAGGTMTGDITLADGGKALSDAVVGTIVSDSLSSSVSLDASTGKTIISVNLSKGVWIVTGHCQYTTNTASRIYGLTISTNLDSYSYGNDGSVAVHSSLTGTIALQTSVILSLNSSGTAYLNGYATISATVSNADITAIRIK